METGLWINGTPYRNIVLIFIPNYYNPLWRLFKRWKRWKGEFYHGADEYGLEKDLTHKMVEKMAGRSGV